MSEHEVELSEEERERLFFQPFTSKGRQLRRPLSADEVAERVEQLIGARLADAEARAEAAEANMSDLEHDLDQCRERLWRLAAKAGWRPGNPADNDATAELVIAEAIGTAQHAPRATPGAGHQLLVAIDQYLGGDQ